MLRPGTLHAHQHQDGPEKTFRVGQRQVEEEPQRECGLDGHIRVYRLGAPPSGLRRRPGIDGVLTESQSLVVPDDVNSARGFPGACLALTHQDELEGLCV